MKERFIDIPLHKNEETKRFEIKVDGHLAFIDYRERGDKVSLIHTEAEPELAGTGAAKAVVETTLNWIAENNKTILPYCPYVFGYIKRNPEWKQIVDKSFESYDKLMAAKM